jgi:hypothetical protein
MLADALRVVPYCDAHRDVWSPRFTTIILESCSQLDSLLKAQAHLTPALVGNRTRFNIGDYQNWFGADLAVQRAVFFDADPAKLVQPFSVWDPNLLITLTSPPWWSAYNKLKHSRLEYHTEATQRHAVDALAGLFVAILRSEICDSAIINHGWLRTFLKPSILFRWPLRSFLHGQCAVAETTLFAHPFGMWPNDGRSYRRWEGQCSYRFSRWYGAYTGTT